MIDIVWRLSTYVVKVTLAQHFASYDPDPLPGADMGNACSREEIILALKVRTVPGPYQSISSTNANYSICILLLQGEDCDQDPTLQGAMHPSESCSGRMGRIRCHAHRENSRADDSTGNDSAQQTIAGFTQHGTLMCDLCRSIASMRNKVSSTR